MFLLDSQVFLPDSQVFLQDSQPHTNTHLVSPSVGMPHTQMPSVFMPHTYMPSVGLGICLHTHGEGLRNTWGLDLPGPKMFCMRGSSACRHNGEHLILVAQFGVLLLLDVTPGTVIFFSMDLDQSYTRHRPVITRHSGLF